MKNIKTFGEAIGGALSLVSDVFLPEL